MPNRILYILVFALSLAISFSAVAQQNQKNNFTTPIKPTRTNINPSVVPGVVIVKLKPAFKHFSNNANALRNHPEVAKRMKSVDFKKFEKMFPRSKQPLQALNKHGKKTTDITLIHALKFPENIPVQTVIDALMASGVVEYAEPQFIEKMLYIPNDPISQPNALGELLLQRINAYKAWDVEKGNPNVIIGVLDTGTELNHPDLQNNIYYNLADPINGFDDDGDGYVDNYNGWDMGSNDNNPTWQVAGHGVNVQGACSATPDNGIGIAGTGFYSTCMPIKISNSGGAIVAGYQGIVYAAEHGVKVMNLSWGGFGAFSQANQDIINYAALDWDVTLVASAGNTEGELDFYPASYDNVLSVCGLDTIYSPLYDTLVERRTKFSPTTGETYSFNVDIGSLVGGQTTDLGGGWLGWAGSSFASPVVAGAAALVRAKYPALSGLQVAELIRANGQNLDTFDVTRPESRYKCGRKLDMFKALTNTTTPSVRMESFTASSKYGMDFFSGDTITITQNFFNYLSGTSNLTVKMRCTNGYAIMYDSISVLGSVDSLTGTNNFSDPFKIIIGNNAGPSQVLDLVLFFDDPVKNYHDYQGFKIVVNPSYLKLDTNKVKTTITSIGRFGYNNYETASPTQGIGVKYQNNDLLYEGGLMIGTSSSAVSDGLRGNGFQENEFKNSKNVKYLSSTLKDMESYSVFNDSLSANIIGVQITQRSYAWKSAPNDKFIVIEYCIKNNSSNTYDSLFAGLFADWDIGNYQYNRADWDDARKIGYTYSVQGGYKVAGISLLTDNAPSCFSMDNSNVGGNNINPNNGYTTIEKFNCMANGVFRKQAGTSGFGNDVAQVISAKITNLAPGDSEFVAFAILAGDDVSDILVQAQNARNKFLSIKSGPKPNAPNHIICRNETVDITIQPTNGSQFAFFPTPATTGAPLHIGNSYTISNASAADTIYVANKDSLFYSAIEPVYISKDNMSLQFYPYTDTIQVAFGTPLVLVSQSNGASSLSWDLGDLTNSTASFVSHTYAAKGYYTVALSGISPLLCQDTLKRVVRVGNVTSTIDGVNEEDFMFYPNPVQSSLEITINGNRTPNNTTIEVTNSLGVVVYSSPLASQNNSIDLSEFPSGIYYVKIKHGSSELNRKIVKQ